ncbi:hypothetical protein LTR78_006781 [Recurvomyces mirabilis]|uniref:Uncharacterized protein n=1 Tax=Recurvomyces mirabilis TaxID=574656 RepID=A0AAE1BZ75_9PEZI|nr:hypothetical protein LTR78_006781 [Recurvomyces mirabilis]KAK5153229.1 hypothetical protein LTS14_007874 [Recurvomyces mirabilis]
MAAIHVFDDLFLASLNSALSRADVKTAGVPAKVEASIRKVLDVRISSAGAHISPLKRESALELLRSLVKSWRTLLPENGCPTDKLSLSYTAVCASNRITWHVVQDGNDLLACLTGPLKAENGLVVPKLVVEDIIIAACRMYLILHHATPEIVEVDESQQRMQAVKLTPTLFDENASISKSVKLHQLGDPGYLPAYPTFRAPTTIRLRKLPKDGVTSSSTPQPVAISPSPPKIVMVEDTKESKTSNTPSKDTGKGNSTHATAVPWLEDELEFAITLLIVFRSTSWGQLTDTLNEHFRKRPGLLGGKVIQRGNRTRDSVRQNHAIKYVHSQLARLDEQSNPQNPAIDIDWAAEYQRMHAAESSEVESSSGEEEVKPKVKESGWLAINSSKKIDDDQDTLENGGDHDSSGGDHDALGDIDEMMRRDGLGELELTEDDFIA